MAIVCEKYLYILTTAGIIGDLTGKVCDFTITNLLPFLLKKSGAEDFCTFYANQQKLACPKCCRYTFWAIIDITDNEIIINQQQSLKKENQLS